MRPIAIFRFVLGLLVFVFASAGAMAQIPGVGAGAPDQQAAAPAPDPLGRDTPQGLVSGLISALGASDHDRLLRFFEIEKIPADVGRSAVSEGQLAGVIQDVLNRAGTITTPAELSAEPTGQLNDGLAEDLERIGTLTAPDGQKSLLARRTERDGRMIWVVAAESLRLANSLVGKRGIGILGGRLSERIPQGFPIFGAPAAHWVALLVVLLLSFAITWVLFAGRGVIIRTAERHYGAQRLRFIDAAVTPLRLLVAMIVFRLVVQSISLSIVARYYATFLTQIVLFVTTAWLLWRIADAASNFVLGQMSRHGRLTAYSAVSFLNRAFKGLLVVLLLAILLNAFGVNVTTGLAALGIGGLAIALGAQKLFENLIGSLTLIADRPIRIGDFCRFGSALGTVEDIGIRSTRIRTLDRTVLTVPNGEFSSLHIENYTQRDRFWFHPTLNLRYETTPDQIRYLLQELRAMLYAHPKVDREPARVRLVALAAYSVDIEIFAYVHADDYHHFLEIQEDLLLRCMEIVQQSGTGFAFPSQTLYLGRDDGIDQKRTERAEETVRRRVEEGELEVPRFRPETIEALRGTIPYPPAGAAIRGKSAR